MAGLLAASLCWTACMPNLGATTRSGPQVVLAASPENVGCMPTDYVHPNSIDLLLHSTLVKPMLVR